MQWYVAFRSRPDGKIEVNREYETEENALKKYQLLQSKIGPTQGQYCPPFEATDRETAEKIAWKYMPGAPDPEQ